MCLLLYLHCYSVYISYILTHHYIITVNSNFCFEYSLYSAHNFFFFF